MGKVMKRAFTVTLISAAAIGVFGALVHAVLVVGHVAEPASATVHGLTLRRAWATASAGLALLGVIAGGLAQTRSAAGRGDRMRAVAIIAASAGLLAAVSGGINVAMARGGPGSGNGVVGGAAALILGLVAVALGARALTRSPPRLLTRCFGARR
jgi:hypothetical protein